MFKILIAEDDLELRQLFRHVLLKNGYTVKGVSDGQEALDALEKDYYDLIISDIMMPNMDGYEATRCIRACKEKGGDSVKIIAVTSDTHSEDVRRILSSGMDAHVAKPVDIKALKAAIHTLSAS